MTGSPADDARARGAALVEELWFGESASARLARAALAPVAAAYAMVAGVRGRLYDHGFLAVHATAVPAIGIGNLTVGGTGKTPVAAWVGAALQARGRRPGIVLRRYATGDEVLVHEALNPGVPVVADADRVAGIATIAARGCDVAVLDDAFQHRRADRAADLVLISADSWARTRWPMPAGPWREPVRAVRRATVVLITRKAADAAAVARVLATLQRVAPTVPTAVVALVLDAMRTLGGEQRPLSALRGAHVCAVAGVGWPAAFFAQLEALGAHVEPVAFPDHHQYTADDVAAIQRRVAPGATVVCTLKDAVKLGRLWPREGDPIWYVSQRVEFERGIEAVQAAFDVVHPTRPGSSS